MVQIFYLVCAVLFGWNGLFGFPRLSWLSRLFSFFEFTWFILIIWIFILIILRWLKYNMVRHSFIKMKHWKMEKMKKLISVRLFIPTKHTIAPNEPFQQLNYWTIWTSWSNKQTQPIEFNEPVYQMSHLLNETNKLINFLQMLSRFSVLRLFFCIWIRHLGESLSFSLQGTFHFRFRLNGVHIIDVKVCLFDRDQLITTNITTGNHITFTWCLLLWKNC